MQRQPHKTSGIPRFYVNTHGELVDRTSHRRSRTGYSMIQQRVTRSELQVLADLLNEPAHQRDYDAGVAMDDVWTARLDKIEAQHSAVRLAHVVGVMVQGREAGGQHAHA